MSRLYRHRRDSRLGRERGQPREEPAGPRTRSDRALDSAGRICRELIPLLERRCRDDRGRERDRSVVDALYEAYLAGDGEGMLAQMADDVEVRFLAPGNVSRRSCGQTLHAVLGRAASPPRLPHQKDDRRRRRGRDLGRVRDHGRREAEGEPRGGRDSSPERQNRRAIEPRPALPSLAPGTSGSAVRSASW
jgi:ketosteroid isomerase-like protein